MSLVDDEPRMRFVGDAGLCRNLPRIDLRNRVLFQAYTSLLAVNAMLGALQSHARRTWGPFWRVRAMLAKRSSDLAIAADEYRQVRHDALIMRALLGGGLP